MAVAGSAQHLRAGGLEGRPSRVKRAGKLPRTALQRAFRHVVFGRMPRATRPEPLPREPLAPPRMRHSCGETMGTKSFWQCTLGGLSGRNARTTYGPMAHRRPVLRLAQRAPGWLEGGPPRRASRGGERRREAPLLPLPPTARSTAAPGRPPKAQATNKGLSLTAPGASRVLSRSRSGSGTGPKSLGLGHRVKTCGGAVVLPTAAQ